MTCWPGIRGNETVYCDSIWLKRHTYFSVWNIFVALTIFATYKNKKGNGYSYNSRVKYDHVVTNFLRLLIFNRIFTSSVRQDIIYRYKISLQIRTYCTGICKFYTIYSQKYNYFVGSTYLFPITRTDINWLLSSIQKII